MSISTEITRITNDKNKIRNKLVNLGIAESTSNLDQLAQAIDGIANRGAPNAQVTEGDSYTIEPGYYSGGSVQGVSGGGNYSLQSKTITPTKQQQAVSPDAGYYGLSGVTVESIPETYQDVSSVTATAADVVANKIFVTSGGVATPGTMVDNGTITTKTLDATTNNQSYTIPAGKHSGSGKVQVVLETKTATPTTGTQNITPTSGKVLSKVTVNPIPAKYGDVSSADVTASAMLAGAKALSNVNGVATVVTGTMPDNGSTSGSIDGLSTTTYSIPSGHTTGGTVSLTGDIEEALAAI